jgi:DNA-binding LytR/AlgR family response regulator
MQNQHFFYRTEGVLKQVLLDEIIYLEARDNYTKFFTGLDTFFMVRATLENCLNQLPQNAFLRIHRSFAVAGKQIAYVTRVAVLLPAIKVQLPVSKQYYPLLMKQIIILQNGESKDSEQQEKNALPDTIPPNS